MNLRPRNVEKEIGPPTFRYRPVNYLEKVTDTLRYRNPATVASNKEVFAPNLLNKHGSLSNNLRIFGPNKLKLKKLGKQN